MTFAPGAKRELSARRRACLKVAAVCLLLATALAQGNAARAAASPRDIITRAAATYDAANTFSATTTRVEVVTLPDGKQRSLTTTIHIQFKKPRFLREDVVRQVTVGAPGKPSKQTLSVISDSKTVWTYSVEKNKYIKRPIPGELHLSRLLGLPIARAQNTVKFGSLSPAESRTQFLVLIMPDPSNLPPKMPAAERTKLLQGLKPLAIRVDKKTLHFLSVDFKAPGQSVSLTFADQRFNPPVPASAFQFTPPRGAEEQKIPVMPPGHPMVPLPAPPAPPHR